MLYSNWVRPYIDAALARLTNVTMHDQGSGQVVIKGERKGGLTVPMQKVTISVYLGQKIDRALQDDITAGNKLGQDLIGEHLAKLLREHLESNHGSDLLNYDIHVD